MILDSAAISERLLFWPALPLIAAQGLWLKRRALRFASAPGVTSGSIGCGPELRVLALGDSIIAGVGAVSLDQALPGRFAAALAAVCSSTVFWQAHGRSGADAGTLQRELLGLVSTRNEPVDLVLISTGVNDVTGLRRSRVFRRDLHHFITGLRDRLPNCRLVFAAVPPLDAFPLLPQPLRGLLGLRARTLDRVLIEVAGRYHNVMHVAAPFRPQPSRFCADGFHPDAATLAEWGRYLAARCVDTWPELGGKRWPDAVDAATFRGDALG